MQKFIHNSCERTTKRKQPSNMRVLNYLILLSPLCTAGVSAQDEIAQRLLRVATEEARRLQTSTRVCFDVEYVNGAINVELVVDPQGGPQPMRVCFDVEYINGAINVELVVDPQGVPQPAPVPAPVTAPVTVPFSAPAPAPTPGLPNPNPAPACEEGAMEIYNGDHGGWISIRCPYSCTGCVGVIVHENTNGGCVQSCVTPNALNNDDYECGGCR